MVDHTSWSNSSWLSSPGYSQERFIERIGLDLHDGAAQGIASTLLCLSELRHQIKSGVSSDEACLRIDRLEQGLRSVLGDLYSLILQLRPPALEIPGTEQKIRAWISDVDDVCSPSIELEVEGEEPTLSRSTQIAVLRIIQEAVANASQHADARHVRVTLRFGEDAVDLVIADDGEGAHETTPTQHRGIGMDGIRSRAQWLGGDAAFDRAPGGARVSVRIPVWEPETDI